MSILLPGTPEFPGEDGHRLPPYWTLVFLPGVPRRWAVIMVVVSARGRSSEFRDEQGPTRARRILQSSRRPEGRHRRARSRTGQDVISEILGDGRGFDWLVVMSAVLVLGLRRRARRRLVQMVLPPYLS